jgi:hypothetical protein
MTTKRRIFETGSVQITEMDEELNEELPLGSDHKVLKTRPTLKNRRPSLTKV